MSESMVDMVVCNKSGGGIFVEVKTPKGKQPMTRKVMPGQTFSCTPEMADHYMSEGKAKPVAMTGEAKSDAPPKPNPAESK